MSDSVEQTPEQNQETIQEVLDRAIEDGVLTNDEHEQLMNRMHKDGQIDAKESALISKLFALIREGKLKIVDSDREAAEIQRQRDQEKQAQTPPPKTTE